MLSLAEDTSGLVKESAIAMHPLLQKQNTLYKWLSIVERLLTKKSLRKLVRKSKNHQRCQGYSLNPKAQGGVSHGEVVLKTKTSKDGEEAKCQ